jgi:hypothetical protein
MERFYNPDGTVTRAQFHEGPMIPPAGEKPKDLNLLPRGWQYAQNEFGQSVYCSACPNDAWLRDNITIIQHLAKVFDEIWYDDEFRVDSDQFAGENHQSTASCYCAHCLQRTSKKVGRTLTAQDVVGDQQLHDAWIAQKVEALTHAWNTFVDAGRAINPKLRVGLMIRWGGEERDGLDAPAIVKKMPQPPLLRLGEGHFNEPEYKLPESQVIEYLVSSYHVSWYPKEAVVKSETTYFAPFPRKYVLKKAALALAAGARQLSYCPCMAEWIEYQSYIAQDHRDLERYADALGDKADLWGDIQIVRGAHAAAGDRRPVQRRRDRQPFPLFGLAGLCSSVVRVDGWRQNKNAPVVAVTGRAIWDYPPTRWSSHQTIVLDGAALLENSAANESLGLTNVQQSQNGVVTFNAAPAWKQTGRLSQNQNLVLIPVVWQDIPAAEMDGWLRDIRTVLAPRMPSPAVQGDLYVIPIHYRRRDRLTTMLVNLTDQPKSITLAGRPVQLAPDAIQIV